jgi:hypothetical protein
MPNFRFPYLAIQKIFKGPRTFETLCRLLSEDEEGGPTKRWRLDATGSISVRSVKCLYREKTGIVELCICIGIVELKKDHDSDPLVKRVVAW